MSHHHGSARHFLRVTQNVDLGTLEVVHDIVSVKIRLFEKCDKTRSVIFRWRGEVTFITCEVASPLEMSSAGPLLEADLASF